MKHKKKKLITKLKLVPQTSRAIQVSRTRIRPFEDQPREFFDQAKLMRLGLSIQKVGQKVPVLVRALTDDPLHDWELVDGQRRWLSCGMVKVNVLDAYVIDVKDNAEQFETSAIANFGRAEHTALEAAKTLQRVKNDRGATIEEVADIFTHSVAWVTQHLSLLKLSPEVQELMNPHLPEERQLKYSMALLLINLPADVQLRAATHIVQKGMKLGAAKHYVAKLAAELNVPLTVRKSKRSPHEDYDKLATFVRNLRASAGLLLDMPMSKFDDMFRSRKPDDLTRMLAEMGDCIDDLMAIRQVVERIQNQPEAEVLQKAS